MNKEADSNSSTVDIVSLSIPCKAQYVSIARLAMLGVASRLPFSFDEVEDLRLAVGEACTQAVEQASSKSSDKNISITCRLAESSLETIVSCEGLPMPIQSTSSDSEMSVGMGDYAGENLGMLLMEILVDQVEFKENQKGYEIRLTKRPALNAAPT
jgi:serine/threonine-protein kinase RsbW